MSRPDRGSDPFDILDTGSGDTGLTGDFTSGAPRRTPADGADNTRTYQPAPSAPYAQTTEARTREIPGGEERGEDAQEADGQSGRSRKKRQKKGDRVKHGEPKQKKAKKKHGILFKIGITLLVLVLLVGAAGGYLIWDMTKGLDSQKLDKGKLGITTGLDSKVKNIALFGVDSRDSSTNSRSDSIMILSVDKAHNKVKVSSIMRDAYVNIPDRGYDKITHAYAFGGPELAIRTLNENFQLDIADYATVNFNDMAEIVDAVGGVTLEISDEEAENANNSIAEQCQIAGKDPSAYYFSGGGTYQMNGIQAVAYSRIRYVGNGDFGRTERQREVLSAIFSKALNMSPLEYPDMVKQLLSLTTTSIGFDTVMAYGPMMLGKPTFETSRFPCDGDYWGDTSTGTYYMMFDEETTVQKLHDFIYNDVAPA